MYSVKYVKYQILYNFTKTALISISFLYLVHCTRGGMMVWMSADHPDFEEALTIARTIPVEHEQAWTLAEIGTRQGHVGIEPDDVVAALFADLAVAEIRSNS